MSSIKVSKKNLLILSLVLFMASLGSNYLMMDDMIKMMPANTGYVTIGTVSLQIIPVTTDAQLDVTFVLGQNWFSFPVAPENATIAVALLDLGAGAGVGNDVFYPSAGCTGNASDDFSGNYSIIWSYNASDSADPWKSYDPTQNCFALPSQDLQTVNRFANYQITMTSAETLHINGTVRNYTEKPLTSGQNWVGYPSMTSQNMSDALRSIGNGAGVGNDVFYPSAGCTGNASDDFSGNYSVVWSYNASDSADPWKSYDPTQNCFALPSQDLQKMVPGAGYQITMTDADTWVVDW